MAYRPARLRTRQCLSPGPAMSSHHPELLARETGLLRRKIMPVQQVRSAERVLPVITRKSNVNGLAQRHPG